MIIKLIVIHVTNLVYSVGLSLYHRFQTRRNTKINAYICHESASVGFVDWSIAFVCVVFLTDNRIFLTVLFLYFGCLLEYFGAKTFLETFSFKKM